MEPVDLDVVEDGAVGVVDRHEVRREGKEKGRIDGGLGLEHRPAKCPELVVHHGLDRFDPKDKRRDVERDQGGEQPFWFRLADSEQVNVPRDHLGSPPVLVGAQRLPLRVEGANHPRGDVAGRVPIVQGHQIPRGGMPVPLPPVMERETSAFPRHTSSPDARLSTLSSLQGRGHRRPEVRRMVAMAARRLTRRRRRRQ